MLVRRGRGSLDIYGRNTLVKHEVALVEAEKHLLRPAVIIIKTLAVVVIIASGLVWRTPGKHVIAIRSDGARRGIRTPLLIVEALERTAATPDAGRVGRCRRVLACCLGPCCGRVRRPIRRVT